MASSELETLKLKIEKLEAALHAAHDLLTSGGYNSVRDTVALMAEGEGSDHKIYMAMADRILPLIDEALTAIREAIGGSS